jgi:DNA-binding transcriptional MerR regulator
MTESERKVMEYGGKSRWLTARQVAEMCGAVAPQTVRGWTKAGLLAPHNIALPDAKRRTLRYDRQDVERFWRSRRVDATAA